MIMKKMEFWIESIGFFFNNHHRCVLSVMVFIFYDRKEFRGDFFFCCDWNQDCYMVRAEIWPSSKLLSERYIFRKNWPQLRICLFFFYEFISWWLRIFLEFFYTVWDDEIYITVLREDNIIIMQVINYRYRKDSSVDRALESLSENWNYIQQWRRYKDRIQGWC